MLAKFIHHLTSSSWVGTESVSFQTGNQVEVTLIMKVLLMLCMFAGIVSFANGCGRQGNLLINLKGSVQEWATGFFKIYPTLIPLHQKATGFAPSADRKTHFFQNFKVVPDTHECVFRDRHRAPKWSRVRLGETIEVSLV